MRRDEPYESIVLGAPAVKTIHSQFLRSATMLDMGQLAVPIRRRVTAAEGANTDSENGRSAAIPIPENITAGIGFVAVIPCYMKDRLLDRMGYMYNHLPRIVDWSYFEGQKLSRPYFDGHMGVCLKRNEDQTNNSSPFAACCGSLTADGPLIMQIQGLAKKEFGQEIPGGFDWKLTLVKSIVTMWQMIASSMPEMAGKPTAILSADNSRWATVPTHGALGLEAEEGPREILPNGRAVSKPEIYKRLRATYDGTAKALGATTLNRFGNHILPSEFDMPK